LKDRTATPSELFCAREIIPTSLQSDVRLVDCNEQKLLVVGNYLLEASGGKEISVLSATVFERDYTVVITWARQPTENDLIRLEAVHGFFRLASHERALFCKPRERKIHTANGHAVYTGEKMLLRLGVMRWVEVTLAYDEQAACYYALNQTGQRLDFSASMQQAAMHPLGCTCWGIWSLPDSA
jgi:hypothetical protein